MMEYPGFINFEMEEGYDMNALLGEIEKEVKQGGLKDGGDIVSVNGLDDMDGWDIMNSLRSAMREREIGAQMLIVKTNSLKVRFAGIKKHSKLDLVRLRGQKNTVEFWYEFAEKNSYAPVKQRKYVSGFEASAFDVTGQIEGEIQVIFPCSRGDYDKIQDEIKEADLVDISGMMVESSGGRSKEQKVYFLVQDYEVEEEDYSVANEILPKIKDWKMLIPMRHVGTEKPLFPEIVNLSLLCSAIFVRDGVAAIDPIYFGETGQGKTAVAKYLVCNIMNGSQEDVTAGAGKGMIPSHKEGAPPSKLFTEKRALLVDEMLKAVDTGSVSSSHYSYATQLSQYLGKHLQILQREEINASSGVGIVKGKMTCSFIGTENNDHNLIKALGRAFCMKPAAFRRFCFVTAERENYDENSIYSDKSSNYAKKWMDSYFFKTLGRNALAGMRALYMFSRKFTRDVSLEAPVDWKMEVGEEIKNEMKAGSIPGYPSGWWNTSSNDDSLPSEVKKICREKADLLLRNYIRNMFSPIYVSCGIVRGFVVHDDIDSFEPVFDEDAKEMAKEVVKYMFKDNLMLFQEGIEDFSRSKVGISRSNWR